MANYDSDFYKTWESPYVKIDYDAGSIKFGDLSIMPPNQNKDFEVNVAGYDPASISSEVGEDRILHISAESKDYIDKWRFVIGEKVDLDAITIEYKFGMLKVRLPEKKKKVRSIPINAR